MNIFDPPNELKPLFCNWFKGLTVSSAEFLSQVFIIIYIYICNFNIIYYLFKYIYRLHMTMLSINSLKNNMKKLVFTLKSAKNYVAI